MRRRELILGLLTLPTALKFSGQSLPDTTEDPLTYPPFDALTEPEQFGYAKATKEQREKALTIINGTPFGPQPVDAAASLVNRYFVNDPDAISQWPVPKPWNPLIVAFFSATSTPANNDMTPWCAAFVNWCLERCNRIGSRSASSQSFLSKDFTKVSDPKSGDLAVFTCYDLTTNKSLDIGHVCFFKEKLAENRIKVVGGNQSQDGHYSIISESEFTTTDHRTKRRINNTYVPCVRRLNTFIRID